jgi:hypothetical protein
MKVLVYHGPGQRGWDSVPDPTVVDPTDIVVRIETLTICGSDLHILAGDVPETTPGRVLGHETVGTVEEIGAAVSTVTLGDRVLRSCISSCGRCRFCEERRYGLCLGGGGWIFGHLIDALYTPGQIVAIDLSDTPARECADVRSAHHQQQSRGRHREARGAHRRSRSRRRARGHVGLDYTNCSPFRLPIARFAAAQAAVANPQEPRF